MRRRDALAAANVAVLASVMFAVFPASAQGPSSQAEMTVDELVARALADNPDLRAARREIDAALGRLKRGAPPGRGGTRAWGGVNGRGASQRLLAGRGGGATLQLRALAGMTPDAPLSLRGDLSARVAPADRGEAVARALAGRADLEAARADAAASRARILKEQAEGRWDASVNLGYMRQDFGFELMGLTAQGQTRPIQDVFHYFGGGVSIMLPVRNRNQGNIAAARAEAEAAERRVEFATLTVRQEVEAAFVQYEAARRGREIYERGVLGLARRDLDVVLPNHDLCRGWPRAVLAQQRRYIETENGYTDALKQVYDAAVEIERTVGARGR